ncbi:restriction endonuclease subunit M [Candidatus Giovannonibacteria bacterium RIFCSPLOWO2_01_FULL_44_40]|uniref:Restriction endonuclease subunit M n=1 Tax=Candidatus Giovannonibacteria bacterium RIFCSPHIGHO2_01_FULL_45_23 TaxID=1798325 RepID=A0A1F5VFH9_9BACT|nr:MAG: restriction endonuclease subunit M [Candidatus Giovannonibacteria bacterium RIFCSPHIGHO2_01_FULL_45_23]OGF75314.1 MAG: restriction endonuclease subunit M [Candidatus Giovannonibacteria bacterium RIFCSPHIGHO2_02_FULL_45_13]OGF79697.1 MAG: restriction endonuclease subunit M [Candidatus Giovannonibacteria bacterium RIFCSPLOWO2_01_FULL_44_40]
MQIKSKQRVKDHGEVFTQEREVNAMLDLVKNETERIESRFLEPACGNGNFLAPILERKLALVKKKYGPGQAEFERMAFLAISSIYGVELLHDNVEACIERLYNILNDVYAKLYKDKCKDEFRTSIHFVLKRNILQGDALTLKKTDGKEYIIFSEWSLVNGGMIKRRDFQYAELADFDPKKPTLFSLREVSDTGETVFSPMPVKEFPLVHYLSLNYEDAK